MIADFNSQTIRDAVHAAVAQENGMKGYFFEVDNLMLDRTLSYWVEAADSHFVSRETSVPFEFLVGLLCKALCLSNIVLCEPVPGISRDLQQRHQLIAEYTKPYFAIEVSSKIYTEYLNEVGRIVEFGPRVRANTQAKRSLLGSQLLPMLRTTTKPSILWFLCLRYANQPSRATSIFHDCNWKTDELLAQMNHSGQYVVLSAHSHAKMRKL